MYCYRFLVTASQLWLFRPSSPDASGWGDVLAASRQRSARSGGQAAFAPLPPIGCRSLGSSLRSRKHVSSTLSRVLVCASRSLVSLNCCDTMHEDFSRVILHIDFDCYYVQASVLAPAILGLFCVPRQCNFSPPCGATKGSSSGNAGPVRSSEASGGCSASCAAGGVSPAAACRQPAALARRAHCDRTAVLLAQSHTHTHPLLRAGGNEAAWHPPRDPMCRAAMGGSDRGQLPSAQRRRDAAHAGGWGGCCCRGRQCGRTNVPPAAHTPVLF